MNQKETGHQADAMFELLSEDTKEAIRLGEEDLDNSIARINALAEYMKGISYNYIQSVVTSSKEDIQDSATRALVTGLDTSPCFDHLETIPDVPDQVLVNFLGCKREILTSVESVKEKTKYDIYAVNGILSEIRHQMESCTGVNAIACHLAVMKEMRKNFLKIPSKVDRIVMDANIYISHLEGNLITCFSNSTDAGSLISKLATQSIDCIVKMFPKHLL